MKSRSSRSSSANLATAGASPVWNAAAEIGRQQVTVASEGACAMLRGFDAMRKIQDQAVQQSSLRHAAAAQKLRKPCGPGELIQVQSELMRSDMEVAVNYWQQLAAAALEMQTEMMGCASHLVDSEALLESASVIEAMQSAVPGLDSFLPATRAASPKPGAASRAA